MNSVNPQVKHKSTYLAYKLYCALSYLPKKLIHVNIKSNPILFKRLSSQKTLFPTYNLFRSI